MLFVNIFDGLLKENWKEFGIRKKRKKKREDFLTP